MPILGHYFISVMFFVTDMFWGLKEYISEWLGFPRGSVDTGREDSLEEEATHSSFLAS